MSKTNTVAKSLDKKIVPIFGRVPTELKFKAHVKALEQGISLNEAVLIGLKLFLKQKA